MSVCVSCFVVSCFVLFVRATNKNRRWKEFSSSDFDLSEELATIRGNIKKSVAYGPVIKIFGSEQDLFRKK